MKERRKQERRRWGRKVTYPFIDNEGALVTKNRRRNIDRRDEVLEESEIENKNTSIDITESKMLELEEALKSTKLPEIETSYTPEIVEKNDNDNGVTIELLIKDKKHVLTTDKKICQIGRDPSCDIVIQNKFVSRAHAKIILKDGKFLLEDNSFNGTYIKFNNGQKIHISKDEQTLIASGTMSMGRPVDDSSNSVIEFKISL